MRPTENGRVYKLAHSDTEFSVRLHPHTVLTPDADDARRYRCSPAPVVGGSLVRAVPVTTGIRVFSSEGLSLTLVQDVSEVGARI